MKKLALFNKGILYVLAAILLFSTLIISCEKQTAETEQKNNEKLEESSITIYNTIEKNEYKKLDKTERRIVDFINSGIAALKGLELNSPSNYSEYEATIFISTNDEGKMSNFMTINKSEELNSKNGQILNEITFNSFGGTINNSAPHGRCHVCGMRIAVECYKAIKKYMDDHHQSEIDIHVKRTSDGCVDVTY